MEICFPELKLARSESIGTAWYLHLRHTRLKAHSDSRAIVQPSLHPREDDRHPIHRPSEIECTVGNVVLIANWFSQRLQNIKSNGPRCLWLELSFWPAGR